MRISADSIDDESFHNLQVSPEIVAKLTVTVKDLSKVESAKNAVEDLMKRFKKLDISSPVPFDASAETKNILACGKTMEGGEASSIPSTSDEKFGSNEPVPNWYIKMKEELKNEVISEVMSKLSTKELKKEDTNSTDEDDTDKVLHENVFCDKCNEQIRGIRYKCGNCEDFDFCETCEAEGFQSGHDPTHIFLKIRTPSCFFALRDGGKNKIYQVPSIASGFVLSKASSDDKTKVSKECFRATFIGDENFPDGSIVPPGREFEKIWKVHNSGTKAWTEDTVFHLLWNSESLKACSNVVAAPRLKSGEEGTISVTFVAPEAFGHYESYWLFHHNGKSFGDAFWCTVKVEPRAPFPTVPSRSWKNYPNHNVLKSKRKAIEEFMKRKSSHYSRKTEKVKQQIVENLNAVVNEASGSQRLYGRQRHLVAASHTATPNNSPLDLTPPKSPEPRDFVKINNQVIILSDVEDDEVQPKIIDADDKASIATLSSSDSESEFVVIPMPKCFSHLQDSSICQTSFSGAVPKVVEVLEEQSLGEIELVEPLVVDASLIHDVASGDETTATVEVVSELTEDCDRHIVNVSLSNSPYSSNVSIAETQTDSRSPILGEPLRNRKDSASQIPEVIGNETFETSSCTFPKFPLPLPVDEHTEHLLQTEQSSQPTSPETNTKRDGERTIQVLPEGLVTGALLAAATVYNTARAVISNLQTGKNEEEDSSSQEANTLQSPPIHNISQLSPADQLVEMGFCNRTLNEGLLKEHKGNVARVVAELVNLNDNEWYASRHTPSAPPQE